MHHTVIELPNSTTVLLRTRVRMLLPVIILVGLGAGILVFASVWMLLNILYGEGSSNTSPDRIHTPVWTLNDITSLEITHARISTEQFLENLENSSIQTKDLQRELRAFLAALPEGDIKRPEALRKMINEYLERICPQVPPNRAYLLCH